MTETTVDLEAPLSDLLYQYEACPEGADWAKQFKTASEAWEKCERPEWMLWALEAIGIKNDERYRKFACWCARHTPVGDGKTTWDLLTDDRSRQAVEVGERLARGEATEQERLAARSAAWLAAESAARLAAESAARLAAESAARLAAESAARLAAESAARSDAWSAAESAARLAAWSAAWSAAESAAWSAARLAAWSAQANAIRKIFGNPFRAKKNCRRK